MQLESKSLCIWYINMISLNVNKTLRKQYCKSNISLQSLRNKPALKEKCTLTDML